MMKTALQEIAEGEGSCLLQPCFWPILLPSWQGQTMLGREEINAQAFQPARGRHNCVRALQKTSLDTCKYS